MYNDVKKEEDQYNNACISLNKTLGLLSMKAMKQRNINWITSKWLNEFVQDLKIESKIKIANIKSPEEKPLSLYTTRHVTAR